MRAAVYDLIGPDCPEGTATIDSETLAFEGLTVNWAAECGQTSDGKALFRVHNEDGPTAYAVTCGAWANLALPFGG